MTLRKLGVLGGAAALSLAGLWGAPARAATMCSPAPIVPGDLRERATVICGINAPEDLRALPDGRHLLISETPGAALRPGALAVLDTATDDVRDVARIRDGGPIWGDPACQAADAAIPFAPLGIHLNKRPNGEEQLLLVDRSGPDDRIDFFKLEYHHGALVAAWRGCVRNAGPGMFNAVTNTPHGGFVATVMFEKTAVYTATGAVSPAGVQKTLSGANSGYLMAWAPGQALHKLPGSEAPFNNGIDATNDGKTIYFNAWTGRQIDTYDTATGTITHRTSVAFLPDNIDPGPNHSYVVAGIANPMTWLMCQLHKAAFCPNGFVVAQWAPKTDKVTTLLDEPAGLMPGASMGVVLGRDLYVGSFSGDRVLKVRLAK